MGRYDVSLTSTAVNELYALSPRIADAVSVFIDGPLADNPRRVGKPLGGQFTGRYSARRGSYRIIYTIDDGANRVAVQRIAHRSTSYRPL